MGLQIAPFPHAAVVNHASNLQLKAGSPPTGSHLRCPRSARSRPAHRRRRLVHPRDDAGRRGRTVHEHERGRLPAACAVYRRFPGQRFPRARDDRMPASPGRRGADVAGRTGPAATIRQLALEPRGLVLVSGPTGSGKTTTLAAMVDAINENRAVHVDHRGPDRSDPPRQTGWFQPAGARHPTPPIVPHRPSRSDAAGPP